MVAAIAAPQIGIKVHFLSKLRHDSPSGMQKSLPEKSLNVIDNLSIAIKKAEIICLRHVIRRKVLIVTYTQA